jgi:uncharacterized protein (TIGR03083 family)
MSTIVTTSARPARMPAFDRDVVRRLMTTEYQRVVEQLRSLSADEWHADTCNTGWDVRALAAHMLGMVAMAASVREQMRQMRAAHRRGGEFIDALTALQVDKYHGWSPEQLVAEYQRLAPKAVKGRTRMPRLVRDRTMPDPQPVNPPHEYERWTFAYAVDVILTRDPWMHRTDIAAATGRQMTLTKDHDAVIVDDVVREWAHRHAQPCTLTLTGPIGQVYVCGPGGTIKPSPSPHAASSAVGPSYTCDAVEFCRVLSGRGFGDGLLRTRVPF